MHPSEEPFSVREIWPPETIIKGDYRIERRLGQGGFGIVYLAKHRFLGTMHVIKRLHEHFASNPEYVRKFVKEARAVRRLKGCLNIVEVEHMTQSEDGHLILVMEHIAGGDLSGLMESRRLSVADVIEYARQIATGLEAAHAAGLVHRDIKPENVMISHNSTGQMILKLIDFGIVADHVGQQQTSVVHGGSIGYAAFEQWVKSGKELDGRTDLYALGASMYRMLCGRMPYPVSDIGGWIERVKAGPPVAPSEIRPETPAALSDLILELLSLRPDGRPADAATVIRRLNAIRDSGVAAEPLDPLQRPVEGEQQPVWEKTISSSEAVTAPLSGSFTPAQAGAGVSTPPPRPFLAPPAATSVEPVRRTLVEGPSDAAVRVADNAFEVAAPAFAGSTQPSPRYPVWVFAGAFAILAAAGVWLTTGNKEQQRPSDQKALPASPATPRSSPGATAKEPAAKPKPKPVVPDKPGPQSAGPVSARTLKEPAAASAYNGPKEGRIVWTGELEPGQDIDLGGSSASGSVSGKLPGVPVKFEVHPASLHVSIPPGPGNQWRRLVVHNTGRRLVVVVINWALIP